MAEIVVTQEQMALRRRARRRLVGAVAIALASFVVLPMLFDSEPKPLGPDVDIRIPAQNSPFEPASDPIPRPQPEREAAEVKAPEVKMAEPTQSATAAPNQSASVASRSSDQTNSEKTPAPAAVATEKTIPKPQPKPVLTLEPKPELKPDQAFASQGYFLQLGAFGNESNARQFRDKVAADGFKVAMTSTNGQFRVRVGPMPQHAQALEMQARLKAKGYRPVMLGP